MAYIKTLKDNELIGGADNTDVYPVTSTQAIFSQMPDGTIPEGIRHQRLEDRLQDHEEDCRVLHNESERLEGRIDEQAEDSIELHRKSDALEERLDNQAADSMELHRKTERLVLYLSNDKEAQVLEITDAPNVVSLEGRAQLESFGDEPSTALDPQDYTSRISVSSAGAIIKDVVGDTLQYTLLNIVGTYTIEYKVAYGQVTKKVQSTTMTNLRKFFGFFETRPTDVTQLDASHFSNSVGCTVTIQSSGEGFKRVYLAVPRGMTISRVEQPDALNSPIGFHQVDAVSRTVGSVTHTYKLYESDDLIDASHDKRLTIS